MLPEVQAFFDAQDGSNAAYEEDERIARENPVAMWRETWNAEERATFYAAEEKRAIAQLKARQERRERRAAAMDHLRNSDNPVIKWLATDRVIQRDYISYRDQVLQALPMTREQIEAYGDRQGWCGDYERMMERAREAGVLPEPIPPLADIDALVYDIRRDFGGRDARVRSIVNKHLPAILESAAKVAAERAEAEAKAKAEAEAAEKATEAPTVDTTPADVQPRRRPVPVRNADGTFAGSVTVAA